MKTEFNYGELDAWMAKPTGIIPQIRLFTKGGRTLMYASYTGNPGWMLQYNCCNTPMTSPELSELVDDQFVQNFIEMVENPPTTIDIKFRLDQELLTEWLYRKSIYLAPPIVVKNSDFKLQYLFNEQVTVPSVAPIKTSVKEILEIFKESRLVKECIGKMTAVENYEELLQWNRKGGSPPKIVFNGTNYSIHNRKVINPEGLDMENPFIRNFLALL